MGQKKAPQQKRQQHNNQPRKNTTIKQHWCTGVCSSRGGFRISQQQGNDNGNGDGHGEGETRQNTSEKRRPGAKFARKQQSTKQQDAEVQLWKGGVSGETNKQQSTQQNWVPTCVDGCHVTMDRCKIKWLTSNSITS